MTVTPEPNRDVEQHSLDLPEVHKHNWKSADIRDNWETYFKCGENPLPEIFEDAVLDVSHPRNGYVTTIPSGEALSAAKNYDERGLSFEPLDAEIDDQERAVIADTDHNAAKLKAAIKDDDFLQMAELFGVPECCRKHTEKWRQEGVYDPVYEVACNTPSAVATGDDNSVVEVQDPHNILNVFFSYLGWQFISFYPCSFECDHANHVAKQNGALMRDLDLRHEKTADYLWEFLGKRSIWESYHGLANVRNASCTGEYTCDTRWDKRAVVWKAEHEAKESC
jgi:hypothetical protein